MQSETNIFARFLRFWRQTLSVSQEDLALSLTISRKHLSFLETGKSSPSKELVVNIAEVLQLHERDRNNLLIAAGFVPSVLANFADDDDELWRKKALTIMLKGQDPNPCSVRDRYGYIKAVNRSWVAYHLDWLGGLIFDAPLNAYRLDYAEGGWRNLVKNWDEIGWQSILELKQALLFAPNEEAEKLYQSLITQPDVKLALDKGMQLARSVNVATIKMQQGSGPIQTSTAITTTFTEDPISDLHLLVDTIYPRDFALPHTKKELQADKNIQHPLLYY